MDIFDRAQQRTEESTEKAVRAFLDRPRLLRSTVVCTDCHTKIDKGRIDACSALNIRIILCLDCQEKKERRDKEKKIMKRLRNSMFPVFLVMAFLFASSGASLAAVGSCVQTLTQYGVSVSMPTGNPQVLVKFVCTGSSDDGSIPNQAISSLNMGLLRGQYFLYSVAAYPTSGGPAPDAANVFVLDANGEDLLGSVDGGTTPGKGLNLISNLLKVTTFPYSHFLGMYYFPSVMNTLTLKVSAQATVSAKYTVELTFVK